jgi:hypothetical protein
MKGTLTDTVTDAATRIAINGATGYKSYAGTQLAAQRLE